MKVCFTLLLTDDPDWNFDFDSGVAAKIEYSLRWGYDSYSFTSGTKMCHVYLSETQQAGISPVPPNIRETIGYRIASDGKHTSSDPQRFRFRLVLQAKT